MEIERKLKELGITIPPVPAAGGNYVHAVQTGNLLFLAGKGPMAHTGGEPAYVWINLLKDADRFLFSNSSQFSQVAHVREFRDQLRPDGAHRPNGQRCLLELPDRPRLLARRLSLFVDRLQIGQHHPAQLGQMRIAAFAMKERAA